MLWCSIQSALYFLKFVHEHGIDSAKPQFNLRTISCPQHIFYVAFKSAVIFRPLNLCAVSPFDPGGNIR